jgi:2,3-bisphosphoglycerate-dependent phosphoglycerate mutase
MLTTLFMVRHANSPFIFGQERTRSLSKQGELDAGKIKELLSLEKIDVIVSSPYKRAIQTVEGLSHDKKLEIQIVEELKERQLKGSFKLQKEEINQAIKKSYEDKTYSLLGGESVEDVQARSLPILLQLLTMYQGKTLILGTHGNIMTIIMNYFDPQYGYDFWKRTTKPDLYKLEFLGTQLHSVKRLWDN